MKSQYDNYSIIISGMKKDYTPGQKEFTITQSNPQYQEFEIIQIAGQGTFGVVFKTKHRGKIVALKITLQQKKYRNREHEVIQKLSHCNVISIVSQFYTIDHDQKYLNLVMDYYPSNLYEVIKSFQKGKSKFDHHQLKIISFQLFKAMAYLEDKEVCHRDIKPQNILINMDTLEVKICDFGSAKFMNKGQNNVVYICSRYYRAPELIFGCGDYLYEIDMWSIGCVLVQMLSFQPIFPGASSLEQLLEIVKILGIPSASDGLLGPDEPLSKLSGSMKPLKWSNVLKFYKPNPGYVDLISRILTFDRCKRLKAAQALVHPYFQSLWVDPPKTPLHLLDFSQNIFVNYPQVKEHLLKKIPSKVTTSAQQTVCCTPEQEAKQ